MTIKKYFLCTSFICFFMLFNNSCVHAEKINNETLFKDFNVQIVKDMQTSAEIIDFLIIKLDSSKENLEDIFFNANSLEEFLRTKPKKEKKDWPPLSEITKRKILITYVCQRVAWAAKAAAEKKAQKKSYQMSAEELDQLSPEIRDVLVNISKVIRACAGADYIAKNKRYTQE